METKTPPHFLGKCSWKNFDKHPKWGGGLFVYLWYKSEIYIKSRCFLTLQLLLYVQYSVKIILWKVCPKSYFSMLFYRLNQNRLLKMIEREKT